VRPFVSVLIDTYNHERFIEQAVASVLEQDFPASEMEVLVVDDGSTDRTPEVLRQFEPRVRVIRKANGGQASAFNAGIPQCRGEVIAFLDGDDWWLPGKLRRVADVFASEASVGMLGHAFREFFNDGTYRTVALDTEKRLQLKNVAAASFFRLNRCFFGTSRMAMRRSVALSLGSVPEGLIIEADEYLFTLGAAGSESVILTEPLTVYRLHGGNLFMNDRASPHGLDIKRRSLAVLASSLPVALEKAGVPEDARRCILELVRAEANQLQLMTSGGRRLSAYKAEAVLYRVHHQNATAGQKLFHEAGMLASLLLPPRLFYAAKHWLGRQRWYQTGRAKLLPIPKFAAGETEKLDGADG
jgi:hypothetical protein